MKLKVALLGRQEVMTVNEDDMLLPRALLAGKVRWRPYGDGRQGALIVPTGGAERAFLLLACDGVPVLTDNTRLALRIVLGRNN